MSKIETKQITLVSPNGLVEKTIEMDNSGVVKVDGVQVADIVSGTFTPMVSFVTTTGSITYTVQQGKYTKIGNLAIVSFKVTFSQTGSSGHIKLGNLPFFAIGSPSDSGATYTYGLISVTGTPIARIDSGNNFAYLYQIVNGTATPLGATNTTTNIDIEFTLSYRV